MNQDKFTRMCEASANKLKEHYLALPNSMKYGTRICFRTAVSVVIPYNHEETELSDLIYVIPETIAWRTWCDHGKTDLIIVATGQDFSDEGFPLFEPHQLQHMACSARGWQTNEFLHRLNASFRRLSMQSHSVNEVLLRFTMDAMFGIMFDDGGKVVE